MKRVLIALSVAGTLFFSVTSGAALLCQNVFFSAPSQTQIYELEDQNASQVNDYLHEKMLSQSRRLETAYLKESPYIPVVIVGAGLHASIFSTKAADLGKASSVLALEAGSRVSQVFGELARSFRINSSEREERSSNVFPGSPLVMKDLTTQTFPNSVHMGLMGTAAQRASEVPVLFNHEVVSIQDLSLVPSAGEAHQGRYLLVTSRGLRIFADKVVLATGLGEPSSRVKDPEFQNLLAFSSEAHQKNPRQILPVMMVDSFLRTVALHEAGPRVSALREFKNKSIAVIGAGDGARIAVEAILHKMDPSVKILWLGQKARTPEEYRESTWERYYGIADEMGQRVQGGFQGHVTAGRALKNGRIELTYGEGQKVVADMVLNATGYENRVPALLSHLSGKTPEGEIQYDAILGKIPELTSESTVIGKKVVLPGLPAQEIYVMGPAGGPFASPPELLQTATENPVSVEVLGPRSRHLADSLLAGTKAFKTAPRILKKTSSVTAAPLPVSAKDLSLQVSPNFLKAVVKVELTAALRRFKFRPGQSLQFEPGVTGAVIKVSGVGVSASDLNQIVKSVSASPDLPRLLQEVLRLEGSWSFQPTAS